MKIRVQKTTALYDLAEIGGMAGDVCLLPFSESMAAGGIGGCIWLEKAASFWHGCLRAGGKRSFDVVASLLLLLLAGPILLITMLAIWLAGLGREPVFYRQVRVGLHGEPIRLLKLRTMYVDAESLGPRMAVKDDPRITRIGRILRRTRIDELPQLINVLYGDMSLVGPRPERPEFVAWYERWIEGYGLRHRVKPGITGLAQVHMGYAEDVRDAAMKLYYDLSYIRDGGLRMDFAILLRTVPVVLTGRGSR